MAENLDLVGIGTPSMDVLHTKTGLIGRFGGGSVVTAVVALSRWGFKTGILGRIGDDYYGKRLLEDFITNNVDVSRLRTDKHPTSMWHINVSKDEREILYAEYYKPLEKLSAKDREYLRNSKSVFIRFNNYLFKEIALICHRYNKNMFVTLHLFENDIENENRLQILNKLSSVTVFMDEDEAEKADEIFETLIEKNTVVVTRGKKGCSIYKNGSSKDFKALKVATVDPTGAGDAFAAGFIYGYLGNWPLNKTAKFANVLGAIATMDYGARTKIPTLEEAFELINLTEHETDVHKIDAI